MWAGQLAVLRGTLQALAAISMPGSVVDLQLEWNDNAAMKTLPPQRPPMPPDPTTPGTP